MNPAKGTTKPKKAKQGATGETSSTYAGNGKYGVRFINIRLGKSDVDACKALQLSQEDVWGWFERLTDGGYKISLSYDDKNSCNVVSVTGAAACSVPENAGLCVQARGPALYDAICAAYYKVEIAADGGPFEFQDPETEGWG